MRNCFWYYFSNYLQLSLLENAKKDYYILDWIILVQDFCPLKTKIDQFSSLHCSENPAYNTLLQMSLFLLIAFLL